MIEKFLNRSTGKVEVNQTVLCEMYVFWRDYMLREEDKKPNVVCVLTGDWSGVYLENDEKLARFSPIRFVLDEDNPRQTLEDYLKVTVEMTQSQGAPVRPEQVEKVRRDAYRLYEHYIKEPDRLAALPKPPAYLNLNDVF